MTATVTTLNLLPEAGRRADRQDGYPQLQPLAAGNLTGQNRQKIAPQSN